MPNAELNPISSQIIGKKDDSSFQTLSIDETVIAECPNIYRVEWSEAQRAQQERFKQAIDYARAAMTDPAMHAIYEEMAAHKSMRPCTMAFIDYFKWINLLSDE